MSTNNSKEAEKQYLKRTASEAWERYKPFTPPDNFTLTDSLDMMQDFAATMKHLQPARNDLILDLGAGACWVSEWLNRLNLRSVAVDISLDMLRIGKERLRGLKHGVLTVGDLEHLPFQTGKFDKAVCLNSFHHLPDMQKALCEVSRVLKQEGVVVFSEPGKGHADDPQSQAAMKDFGVLEQEILVSSFVEACHSAGFVQVSLRPLSYVIPQCDLEGDDWKSWRACWFRKRPIRAIQNFQRDLMEFLGLGKKTLLKEEQQSIVLLRILTQSIERHPVIVAFKTRQKRSDDLIYAAEIKVLEAPTSVRDSEYVQMRLNVHNLGNFSWRVDDSEGSSYVRLGIQLLDSDQRLIDRDFFREKLPAAMDPDSTQAFIVKVPVPPQTGKYFFKLDLVLEGVTWFEIQGSTTVIQPIDIL